MIHRSTETWGAAEKKQEKVLCMQLLQVMGPRSSKSGTTVTFMKGKKKVKQKGFTDRKDAEGFIKTHTKQDKSSSDDSITGEDKDSQEQHISLSSEEHHISVCSEEETEQEESLNEEIETEKFCLPECRFDGGDETSEEMINTDICGGWCHLVCVNLIPEKAE